MNDTTIIHDGTNEHEILFPDGMGRGLVPRDYSVHPVGYLEGCPAMKDVDVPLIPRSEWTERAKDLVKNKSRLSDIRKRAMNGAPFPALDQGQVGYCWAHSTTGAVMLIRAAANEPYVPLSAYSIAATIKKGADEGGWGALSLEFAMSKGIVSQAVWPQGDRSYRKYDKPETWEDAALYKITEGWVDLNAQAYDRTMTFDQVITLLLTGTPVVGDFNWWGHSVCLLDAVEGATQRRGFRLWDGKKPSTSEFDSIWGMDNPVTAGWGVRILNSWGDKWGEDGEGNLAGSKAVPDGAVAPRVAMAE